MTMSAATEGGKHEANDCAQEFLLSPQATFDLGHSGLGETPVLKGLMAGFKVMLSLGAVLPEALVGFEPTAFGGFGLSLGVSFHGEHGALLRR